MLISWLIGTMLMWMSPILVILGLIRKVITKKWDMFKIGVILVFVCGFLLFVSVLLNPLTEYLSDKTTELEEKF